MRERTLADWRAAFEVFDTCPWPGPRPLKEGEDGRLGGRERDLNHFRHAVLRNRLVILTGESGVGKSSFLRAGGLPALHDAGFRSLYFREWSDVTSDGTDIEDAIRQLVVSKIMELGRHAQDPELLLDCRRLLTHIDRNPRADILECLGVVLPHRVVLIFDQFEELIRRDRARYQDLANWLILNHRAHAQANVIISMRSEYAFDLLAKVERSVTPFQYHWFELLPIDGAEDDGVAADAAGLREIIAGKPEQPLPIDKSASVRLEELWLERNRSASGSRPRIGGSRNRTDQITRARKSGDATGLLHLQAALYCLHATVSAVQRDTIEIGDVNDLERFAEARGGSFFEVALQQAVAEKLARCRRACTDWDESLGEPVAAADGALIEGTESIIRRLGNQLSSGGFKLIRSEDDLARSAFGREIRVLGADSAVKIPEFVLLLAQVRHEDGDVLSYLDGQWVALWQERDPWEADPQDVSSGPMLGLDPVAIMLEEARRFVFAIEWLDTSAMITLTGDEEARTITLVHDGFGSALQHYAAGGVTPAEAITRLTATRGDRLSWDLPVREQLLKSKTTDSGRHGVEFEPSIVIANVRWRDCIVTGQFDRIEFVNCDFRGTRFEESKFCGVTFVNCLLDAAEFHECDIIGAPVLPECSAAPDPRVPSFEVLVSPAWMASLAKYRRASLSESAAPLSVFSWTSGAPALDRRQFREVVDPLVYPYQSTPFGLVMYGGRLCSMMIRSCKFVEPLLSPSRELAPLRPPTMAFRHISGASLDIVEQEGGRFEIFDGAVRGIAVTADAGTVVPSPSAHLEIEVTNSVLASGWFGDRLRGVCSITNSQVWGIWSLSTPPDFEVKVYEAGFAAPVNVQLGQYAEELSWFRDDPTDDRGSSIQLNDEQRETFLRTATNMDFRSNPAQHEAYRLRRRQA